MSRTRRLSAISRYLGSSLRASRTFIPKKSISFPARGPRSWAEPCCTLLLRTFCNSARLQDGERPRSDNLEAHYRSLVSKGLLRPDPLQEEIMKKLQVLNTDLQHYSLPPLPPRPRLTKASWISSLFGSSDSPVPTITMDKVPKGVYLYGDVGTGKTMLMDLFLDTVPLHLKPHAKRIHFHAFMLDVLQRQHAVQTHYASLGREHLTDATPEVARQLAEEARILCFDEFQVTDIVTAMILRQLLEKLMTFGVVCVMTSNRHPDDLYLNGIQRSSFLPAIQLIKDRFHIIDLNSGTDYRKIPRALSKVYFEPLDDATKSEMRKLFHALAMADGGDARYDRKLEIWGRKLAVPECTENVARFSFLELCGKPLSAADYLEITKTFKTVFVEDVPRMGLDEKDMARRFITFIDACYESKTKVFISSELPIYRIFSAEGPDATGHVNHVNQREVLEDMGLAGDDVGASPLFSGDEEIFAFARCVSRLVQMGTKDWADALER